MASVSSVMAPTTLLHLHGLKPVSISKNPSFQILRPAHFQITHPFSSSPLVMIPKHSKTRTFAISDGAASGFNGKHYVGTGPLNLSRENLQKIIEEHESVKSVKIKFDRYYGKRRCLLYIGMKNLDDAGAVIEKLNGTEVEGVKIKLSIAKKT